MHVTIPAEFKGERVHFIWDNSSEALLFRDGVPVQGFYGSSGDDRREEFLLTPCAKGNETYELVIEMVIIDTISPLLTNVGLQWNVRKSGTWRFFESTCR